MQAAQKRHQSGQEKRHPGFDVVAAVTLEIVTFEATSGAVAHSLESTLRFESAFLH
jgi:hypothetical protein